MSLKANMAHFLGGVDRNHIHHRRRIRGHSTKSRNAAPCTCGVIRNGTGISTLNAAGECGRVLCRFLPCGCCRDPAIRLGGRIRRAQSAHALEAMRDGAVDVFSSNTPGHCRADASMGLQFTNTLYYDGQGFIAPVSLNAKSLKEIRKATVCVTRPTPPREGNLTEYIRANRLDLS